MVWWPLCLQVLNAVSAGPVNTLVLPHRVWWHDYYPASFLTFSDSRLESFYWIQMYKLACGTRPDRVVYDLMGPWFIDGTGWPDLHWDLNLQLVRSPQRCPQKPVLSHLCFSSSSADVLPVVCCKPPVPSGVIVHVAGQ
jgi:hypothetical protein